MLKPAGGGEVEAKTEAEAGADVERGQVWFCSIPFLLWLAKLAKLALIIGCNLLADDRTGLLWFALVCFRFLEALFR